jgi:hypothetical protein
MATRFDGAGSRPHAEFDLGAFQCRTRGAGELAETVRKVLDEVKGSALVYVIRMLSIYFAVFSWIPEICMNKNPEIKTHAYMQASMVEFIKALQEKWTKRIFDIRHYILLKDFGLDFNQN